MKRIGIFYGSSKGSLARLASQIGAKLQVPAEDIRSISQLDRDSVRRYDMLILGSSTGCGGSLQKDWNDALAWLEKTDLSGITVALFGCDNSKENGGAFCNGMGKLYEALKDTGASFTGVVSMLDYPAITSAAVKNDKFVGLAVDEATEGNITDKRVERWVCVLNNNPDTQEL